MEYISEKTLNSTNRPNENFAHRVRNGGFSKTNRRSQKVASCSLPTAICHAGQLNSHSGTNLQMDILPSESFLHRTYFAVCRIFYGPAEFR